MAVRSIECTSLTSALGLRPREVVSFVGSGGKTAALQLLVKETPATGGEVTGRAGRVVATTTTAMFLAQLGAVAQVVVRPTLQELVAGLAVALAAGGPAAAARAVLADDKVAGLPPEWVDELWATGMVDHLLVEADGSRGLSLKAFAPHEPQVPAVTTIIAQVAGLDFLGASLDESHVHRAGLLAALLGEPLGSPVTVPLVAKALRAQSRVLSRRWPAARLITLLNKAEDHDSRAAGLELAEKLLAGGQGEARPEAVVVGSLASASFIRCVPEGPLISAIVLAAGRAMRMGAQKMLLPVGGRPLVQHVVDTALRSSVAETIVVIGAEAEGVRAALAEHPVRIVENVDYELGMSTSLRAGLSAVRLDCEAVVVLLGDQPFVTAATIDLLIAHFREKGAPIVRPVVDGRPAHPVLMATGLFPEILALEGDVGAREILAAHCDEVELVAVDDTRSARDIDTPEDYAGALEEL